VNLSIYEKNYRKNEISAGVDTCGFTSRENIEAMLPYIDFFLYDVKHMDDLTHLELTGVSNRLILDNLSFVSDRGIAIYLRIPVIPGYNDSEENLLALCDFAKDLPSLIEIDLLPIHHLGQARYLALGREYLIEGIPPVGDKTLNEMKHQVESSGLQCKIIG